VGHSHAPAPPRKIVATMQAMAFRDDDLRLLLSGNPMRLSRTVR